MSQDIKVSQTFFFCARESQSISTRFESLRGKITHCRRRRIDGEVQSLPCHAHGNCRNWSTENTIGDHGRTRTGVQQWVAPVLRQVLSRYGLRGIRVSDASNPGPNRFDLLRMEEEGTHPFRFTKTRPRRLGVDWIRFSGTNRCCANPGRH